MTTASIYKSAAGEQAVMAFYDATLARWPVPYEALTVPTRHGATFAIACGESAAPPLALLHGAGTNSLMWGGDVPVYARRYRVVAIDLIGEPGKSDPNRPAWDSPAYAEWLEDVFDSLHIDRAAIAGLSQGGWTALKFATSCPERVSKLVLMTPGGIIPDRTSFIVRALLLSLLGTWGNQAMLRLLFADQPVPEGTAAVMALLNRHFKPRLGVLPIFSDEELRCLTMPTLLLGGAKDALRDLDAIAARLRALLPALTVRIIPGAGHALIGTAGYVESFLGG